MTELFFFFSTTRPKNPAFLRTAGKAIFKKKKEMLMEKLFRTSGPESYIFLRTPFVKN